MRRLSAAALLASVLLLSGCAFMPAREKAPIVADGNSQFTKDGINAIKSSGKVAFDFTRLPLDLSALGLPSGSDGALVAADSGKLIDVSMTTPRGVVDMRTDTIRIRPGADNTVDHIDIFINYPDAQDANAEIRRAADELGFVILQDAEPIGTDFKDGSGKKQWNPGMGNKTGTVFSAEILSNHDTGRMTFIYSVHLAGKYDTPEAQAGIAATGKP
ncbi:hypothetical protein [Pseudarthrobacter sp. LT1]|uniref:hypothetical protein n=1 Tax=Pseudarthrobacter sp. LT1 TaxID=3111450 RepID=UPI002D78E1D1|nr:hypothetical protein [Pseudarthrobacter sp. LT1]WRT13741.1 hypothetical protein VIK36_20795 [Pseudarthrobacter sp. LT1]